MEEKAFGIKASLTAVVAFFTALWGWLGWLVCIWIGCMALDYLSGSLAARKEGSWSSGAAREGLAGKGGMILFVLGAALLDLLLGLALRHMPAVLPFEYGMPICALVLCWYIVTEVGSVIENAERLGGNHPPFLKKMVQVLSTHVLRLGQKAAGGEDDKGDGEE